MPNAKLLFWEKTYIVPNLSVRHSWKRGFSLFSFVNPIHILWYKTANFLAANGVLGTKSKRRYNGKQNKIQTYRYAIILPLGGNEAAMNVICCDFTISREDTDSQIYKNTFINNFELSDTIVEAIVRYNRSRRKVENERLPPGTQF